MVAMIRDMCSLVVGCRWAVRALRTYYSEETHICLTQVLSNVDLILMVGEPSP